MHATRRWTEKDDGVDECDPEYDLSLYGVGIGVAHTWPGDTYLGLTLGAAWLGFDYPGSVSHGPGSLSSERGAYVGLQLGHDWWVSDRWSLGLAARVAFSAVNLLLLQ